MKYHSQRPGSKIMHLFRNWGSFWRKHHSYDSIIKEWNQAYFCRSYAVVCVISPCIAENILGSVWEWGYSNPTLCRKMIIIPYPHISLWIWGRRKSLIVGDVMDDFPSIFFQPRTTEGYPQWSTSFRCFKSFHSGKWRMQTCLLESIRIVLNACGEFVTFSQWDIIIHHDWGISSGKIYE